MGFWQIGLLAVIGLAFCLWKTQSDYAQSGLDWRVAFGAAASFSAFLFVALLFTQRLMKDL